jgi:hypothetical protein
MVQGEDWFSSNYGPPTWCFQVESLVVAMTSLMPLRNALLELGLEDLIPLPEILTTPEVNELNAEYRQRQKVSAALIELLREMKIQVWEGFGMRIPNLFLANRGRA